MKKILIFLKPYIKYTDTSKNQLKRYLIENISKRLLELEFKSNHSIMSKAIKRVIKKVLSSLLKMV